MPAYLWDLDIKVWKNPESNSLSFFELAVGLLNGQFGKWPFNCLADRFCFFALNRPYSHMVWVKQPYTTCLLLLTVLCLLLFFYWVSCPFPIDLKVLCILDTGPLFSKCVTSIFSSLQFIDSCLLYLRWFLHIIMYIT